MKNRSSAESAFEKYQTCDTILLKEQNHTVAPAEVLQSRYFSFKLLWLAALLPEHTVVI